VTASEAVTPSSMSEAADTAMAIALIGLLGRVLCGVMVLVIVTRSVNFSDKRR
jgi:hypothetical protein